MFKAGVWMTDWKNRALCYDEAFVRVSEIVLLGIEWNRAIGLEHCVQKEVNEGLYSVHMNHWFRSSPPVKTQPCVCELRVAYVVGLWPLGHFQLNRTPKCYPSFNIKAAGRGSSRQWGTSEKSNFIFRDSLVPTKPPSEQLDLTDSWSSNQAQLFTGCSPGVPEQCCTHALPQSKSREAKRYLSP